MITLKWKMNSKGLYETYWLGYRVVRFIDGYMRVYYPDSIVNYIRLRDDTFKQWINGEKRLFEGSRN